MSRPRVKVPGAKETGHDQLHGALGAIGQSAKGQLPSLLPYLSSLELGIQREFAPKFQKLQDRLINMDPLRAGLRDQALTALKEIPTGLGNLPPELENQMRVASRAELSSRGIDLRGAGAVQEEAARLLGGRVQFGEQLRSRRLAEAASLLGLSPSPEATTPFSASTILPSTSTLLGSITQGQQLGLSANQMNASLGLQRDQAIGQGLAMLAGGGLAFGIGGVPGGLSFLTGQAPGEFK